MKIFLTKNSILIDTKEYKETFLIRVAPFRLGSLILVVMLAY
jgi:hypothetical protein